MGVIGRPKKEIELASPGETALEFLSNLLSLLANATILMFSYLIVQRFRGHGTRASLSRVPIEYLIIILLLALNMCLGCSETDNRPMPAPEPPVPTISFSPKDSGGGRGTRSDNTIRRSAYFWLASDIPKPNTTYILVNDRFVRMAEGELESERVVFSKVCPFESYDYSPSYLELQIKSMDERSQHLPYHQGDIQLPEGYQFNPYKVGDPSTIWLSLWCD